MNNSSYSNKLHDEINIKVEAFAKYMPGQAVVFIPNEAMLVRQSGWELQDDENKSDDEKKSDRNHDDVYETDIERSVRRSKKIVSDLLLCNAFDMFVTITFAKDRYDIEAKKKQLSTWLKNQRDRNGSFSYVFVPEFHKDGALHFHGAIKGYTGKIVRSASSKTGEPLEGYKSQPIYEFLEYKSGFTRVEIFNGRDRHERSAIKSYVTKYITKDMVSLAGKKRFWTSQKLNRPVTEFNPDWYKSATPILVYKNDFGEFRTYIDSDDLPEKVRKLISEEGL